MTKRTFALFIRTTLCATTSLALLVTTTSSLAQDMSQATSMLQHGGPTGPPMGRLRINPNLQEVRSAATSLPKGAVHLMVRSNADVRQIFTYFPHPPMEARYGRVGTYGVEVSSEGTVAAVTILKSMDPVSDTRIMKIFATWRAKPGPLRVVDISLWAG